MKHMFDVDIAAEYGISEAILLEYLYFWVQKNEANDKHFHNGCYWTYNSVKAFSIQFPYLSEKKVRAALQKLKDNELILTGNFNQSAYDRTCWYALTEKGNSILLKRQMVNDVKANGNSQNGEPIPVIVPIIEPVISPINSLLCGVETPPTKKAVFELLLNDKSLYPIYDVDVEKYKTLYPSADVEQCFRKMIGWIDANPTKRKTKAGIKKFVNGWISKEQDKYKPSNEPTKPQIKYESNSDSFSRGLEKAREKAEREELEEMENKDDN